MLCYDVVCEKNKKKMIIKQLDIVQHLQVFSLLIS